MYRSNYRSPGSISPQEQLAWEKYRDDLKAAGQMSTNVSRVDFIEGLRVGKTQASNRIEKLQVRSRLYDQLQEHTLALQVRNIQVEAELRHILEEEKQ